MLTEAQAKHALARHGLPIPRGIVAKAGQTPDGTGLAGLTGPLALKSLGLAHKSDAGGVRLGLSAPDLPAAMADMPGEAFLIEEMVQNGVAELLLGITRDPAHGFVLTIGAGGVLAEIMDDTAACLVPATRDTLDKALSSLRIAPLLAGHRGRPAAQTDAILDAALALQAYALENADTLEEAEINPLIATPHTAIAADALIRKERP